MICGLHSTRWAWGAPAKRLWWNWNLSISELQRRVSTVICGLEQVVKAIWDQGWHCVATKIVWWEQVRSTKHKRLTAEPTLKFTLEKWKKSALSVDKLHQSVRLLIPQHTVFFFFCLNVQLYCHPCLHEWMTVEGNIINLLMNNSWGKQWSDIWPWARDNCEANYKAL